MLQNQQREQQFDQNVNHFANLTTNALLKHGQQSPRHMFGAIVLLLLIGGLVTLFVIGSNRSSDMEVERREEMMKPRTTPAESLPREPEPTDAAWVEARQAGRIETKKIEYDYYVLKPGSTNHYKNVGIDRELKELADNGWRFMARTSEITYPAEPYGTEDDKIVRAETWERIRPR